ncbi:uncharacterized protein KZ484_000214 isoform 2-T2 [Pholidichthys leucotaenia]
MSLYRTTAAPRLGPTLGGPSARRSGCRVTEECKKKWKSMRDRYLKEVRLELKSKKEGDSVPSKWKYRDLMNFIAPFAGSRSGLDICAANDDDDHHESGSVEPEEALPETVKMEQNVTKVPVASLPDVKSPMALAPQLPAPPQDSQVALVAKTASPPQTTPAGSAARKRRTFQELLAGSRAKWPAKDNGASFPSRPHDEDELFLLSFVPALKRLTPQKRCETKIKIQQIMYEAEFNVGRADSRDKNNRVASTD